MSKLSTLWFQYLYEDGRVALLLTFVRDVYSRILLLLRCLCLWGCRRSVLEGAQAVVVAGEYNQLYVECIRIEHFFTFRDSRRMLESRGCVWKHTSNRPHEGDMNKSTAPVSWLSRVINNSVEIVTSGFFLPGPWRVLAYWPELGLPLAGYIVMLDGLAPFEALGAPWIGPWGAWGLAALGKAAPMAGY